MTSRGFAQRWVNLALRLPESIASRARILAYRMMGMRIGSRCRLGRIRVPRNPWDVCLADGVALEADVVLLSTGERANRPRISIGANVYVNRHSHLDASLSIVVGRGVMIGPFCYITDHDHGTRPDAAVSEQPLVAVPVTIEHDAWLGAGACVLKGVRVGAGAIVGAGAVVTRDVPAGAIVAGVPARVIGWREQGSGVRDQENGPHSGPYA